MTTATRRWILGAVLVLLVLLGAGFAWFTFSIARDQRHLIAQDQRNFIGMTQAQVRSTLGPHDYMGRRGRSDEEKLFWVDPLNRHLCLLFRNGIVVDQSLNQH
jgi:hypothetical protein